MQRDTATMTTDNKTVPVFAVKKESNWNTPVSMKRDHDSMAHNSAATQTANKRARVLTIQKESDRDSTPVSTQGNHDSMAHNGFPPQSETQLQRQREQNQLQQMYKEMATGANFVLYNHAKGRYVPYKKDWVTGCIRPRIQLDDMVDDMNEKKRKEYIAEKRAMSANAGRT
ncbi:hypothetical protein F5B20DRAFT_564390 [Whalleya microplaca]|nr:hypothetical protein F5B20DRAFT_564390 [Whalleya microplaca]